MSTVPSPVRSELRFSARVDYFATYTEASAFAVAKRREGFNVFGGGLIAPWEGEDQYAGLFGVHWIDRKGEGWYG